MQTSLAVPQNSSTKSKSAPPTKWLAVETLTVIVIMAVIAAILFPILASGRNASHKTGCLSNLRQLGLSCQLYTQDLDDTTPGASEFKSGRLIFPFGFGWAGKIYLYVKAGNIFKCPSDGTSIEAQLVGANAQVVSYGLNENLVSLNLSQASSASRTVMFFEVLGSYVSISLPDEGASKRKGLYTKFSPIGNGIKGSLIDSAMPWPGPGQGLTTKYATGILDNSANEIYANDFGGPDGRHSNGSNFLALDGHSVWALPVSISAGSSAKLANSTQTPTGCGATEAPNQTVLPCAEGTQVGRHSLTFSHK